MAFAVWLTGLPASGKSTITRALVEQLEKRHVGVEVLESDAVRRILTPEPTYSREERELFYRALAFCGVTLNRHGVNVVFDATANRRAFRELARQGIARFVEVHVECPLETCQARDFKGTYRRGSAGSSSTVPGLQDPYEPPLHPELHVDSSVMSPEQAAGEIVGFLEKNGML